MSNLLYKVGLISDAHLGGGTNYPKRTAHYEAALRFFKAGGVEQVIGAGDMFDSFPASETSARRFCQLAYDAGYVPGVTFHAVMGNHENNSGTTYASEADKGVEKRRLFWNNALNSASGWNYPGYGYFRYVKLGEDWLCMIDFCKMSDTALTSLLMADVTAFDTFLSRTDVKGRRVLVVQHAIPHRINDVYALISGHGGTYADQSNWQNDATTEEFFRVLGAHKVESEIVWIHGHAHFTVGLESDEDEYTRIANVDDLWADFSVHVPSLGRLKINRSGSIDENQSEFLIASVYDDCIKLAAYHSDWDTEADAPGAYQQVAWYDKTLPLAVYGYQPGTDEPDEPQDGLITAYTWDGRQVTLSTQVLWTWDGRRIEAVVPEPPAPSWDIRMDGGDLIIDGAPSVRMDGNDMVLEDAS